MTAQRPDQIEAFLASAPGGQQAVGDHLDIPAFQAQVILEAKCDARLVFGDKDSCHELLLSGATLRGSWTLNVLPRPTSLCSVTCP